MEESPEDVINRIPATLNQIMSQLSQMVNLRYYMLIYKLLSKGYVTKKHMSECAGISEQRIYTIIDYVEKVINKSKQNENNG